MSDTIKPTRSELMELKKKIQLAISGWSLLKKKRDGLIHDFFKILKTVKNIRQEIVTEYVLALDIINKTRTIENDLRLKSIALAIKNAPAATVGKKNIMGVVVPEIKSNFQVSEDIFVGFYNSSTIFECQQAYSRVLKKVISAAEVETTMRKILVEIEKTKRRVNALEFDLIPRMQKMKSFIQLRLEEVERENTFRMKRIKKK
ncbi:V-type ATP synthase subunit D [Candidatus Woesearchaeota archaeon]|nr:V-type ATP synthase subunit D [Candidatus Woesearchaeota archaeon]